MSILESIKGDRKMSFSHWRYRILHWAFNVKEPDRQNPTQTGLPMFLYTHYCPLFHLTNLIALLSPFILAIRVGLLIISAFATVIDIIPIVKIVDFFINLVPKSTKVESTKTKLQLYEELTRQRAQKERKHCIELIGDYPYFEFDSFWARFDTYFISLSREQAQAIFDEYSPKIQEAVERARLRKQKWKERIIFWTNFSRVFIKWAMNIAYIALSVFLLYVIYLIAQPVWGFLCWFVEGIIWLFSDVGSLSVLWFLLKLLLWTGLGFGVATILVKTGFLTRFANIVIDRLPIVSPPFYIVLVPIRWIRDGFNVTCEFISMFYEENCPPIKLVSEEEAVVESIAKNGEEV